MQQKINTAEAFRLPGISSSQPHRCPAWSNKESRGIFPHVFLLSAACPPSPAPSHRTHGMPRAPASPCPGFWGDLSPLQPQLMPCSSSAPHCFPRACQKASPWANGKPSTADPSPKSTYRVVTIYFLSLPLPSLFFQTFSPSVWQGWGQLASAIRLFTRALCMVCPRSQISDRLEAAALQGGFLKARLSPDEKGI